MSRPNQQARIRKGVANIITRVNQISWRIRDIELALLEIVNDLDEGRSKNEQVVNRVQEGNEGSQRGEESTTNHS